MVVALPLLGTSGVATAKVKPKGCHKTHTCRSGGGTGSGTGGAPAPITIQIDPNPVLETGTSSVVAVIQVETSPSFAGDLVNITSSQFFASCAGSPGFDTFFKVPGRPDSIQVPLDNDGNATVFMGGFDCAPGPSVIEADLVAAPYYTVLATLNVSPPVVTPPGVFGYPTSSGTVPGGEVETADTGALLGGSYVYAVFFVETNPVYAEQTVEISSAQLQARCGTQWFFGSFDGPGHGSDGAGSVLSPISPATATATLDDDGNAEFYFAGASCAAGTSEVIADVMAGTHPTYTTTFTVLPPAPTI
ncbi:MAG TPA: hypothetical protein VNC61_04325 [Acidimicrobiales bacterium]|nr:hypothetical protein [Acidimicrobiales bacterium]